jgi:hypothetical protein
LQSLNLKVDPPVAGSSKSGAACCSIVFSAEIGRGHYPGGLLARARNTQILREPASTDQAVIPAQAGIQCVGLIVVKTIR